MLCAKCQKNEATVHFTRILHGGEEPTLQLCSSCYAEARPIPSIDAGKLEMLPVLAKKCEFCGKDSFSGKTFEGAPMTFWCFDCEAEYRRIFAGLFIGDHPDLMESLKTRSPFPPSFSPQQFQVWSAEAGQRAMQILSQRHHGNRPGAAR